ncbi:hypothetical protein MM300_22030 [Evansella sp. LMS18]|jgi:hypothetical protein|uniref:hypothetical protein n=1 Tax=Evansella sp. LMS18 TaxID=2924033 RepID=UPI0020D023A4|nr:hypothetical protein [Evansella sp. LMS18]UTR10513.1 hypothetical protein MM300_22030 [Evansella sp. LMS18]
MAEHMHAYFRSENDAESALAKLQKLKVENIFVDSIPDDTDRGIFIPAAATNVGGGSGTSGVPGYLEGITHDDENTFTHMLEFEVDEEDAEEAFELLKKEDAYVDESLGNKFKK